MISILLHLLLTNMSSPSALPVRQGLVTNMTLGNETLKGWTMYSLNIDEAIRQGLLSETKPTASPQPAALSPPTFYKGSFIIPDCIPDLPQDTYIQLPKWKKACDMFSTFSYS